MFDPLKNHRELAEWFKATSLSLVKGKTFICSNHILSEIMLILYIYIYIIYINNINNNKYCILQYSYNIAMKFPYFFHILFMYKKKLLWIESCILKKISKALLILGRV